MVPVDIVAEINIDVVPRLLVQQGVSEPILEVGVEAVRYEQGLEVAEPVLDPFFKQVYIPN